MTNQDRVMVTLECDYDRARFPYRPHHYGWLDGRLYYALNAAMGGLPSHLGISQPPRETYEVKPSPMRWSVLIGNCSQRAVSTTHVTATFANRVEHQMISLEPMAHTEAVIGSGDLRRIETDSKFRVVTYVTAVAPDGRRMIYDHLFSRERSG